MNNLAQLALVMLFFSHITLGSTIWNGKIGDLSIAWTTEDIIVVKNDKQVFSAQELAKQDFEADFMADNSLRDNNCTYEREFALLSVVGKIANFEETEYVNCDSMAHPTVTIKFIARDFASGNKVQLTDFFAESDLVTALKNDNLIKAAITKTDPEASTARVSELVDKLRDMKGIPNPNQLMLNGLYKALEWSEITVKNCGYRLAKDYLTQFAFHHLKEDKVAIRLNLLPNAIACQTQNIQLGLYLPIPTDIGTALRQANNRETGFLMNKASKGQTKIAFTTANYSKKQIVTNKTASIEAKPFQPKATKNVSNSNITMFTVRSGHTLYSIAKRFNCTIKEISNWNNLQRPYRIYSGQKLKIITDKISLHKIVIASGVNVRSSPKLEKNVVGSLQFGTTVKQLARSRNPEKVGRFYDYWYKIETATGEKSWIFGQYLSDFIPIKPEAKAKFYFQIAKKRVKKRLDLPNQINLVDFLMTIKDDVQVSPKRSAKLAMLHLRSLIKLVVMSQDKSVEQALDKVTNFIQAIKPNNDLIKELSKLRTVINKTNHPKKNSVIEQIDKAIN